MQPCTTQAHGEEPGYEAKTMLTMALIQQQQCYLLEQSSHFFILLVSVSLVLCPLLQNVLLQQQVIHISKLPLQSYIYIRVDVWSRVHKNGRLQQECVTSIVQLNCTKNRPPGHVLSNNGLCLCTAVQYVLLSLVLVVNSDQFQILWSYTLLLKPPVLMCSYIVAWPPPWKPLSCPMPHSQASHTPSKGKKRPGSKGWWLHPDTYLQVLDDFLQDSYLLAGIALSCEHHLLFEALKCLLYLLFLLQEGIIPGERKGDC